MSRKLLSVRTGRDSLPGWALPLAAVMERSPSDRRRDTGAIPPWAEECRFLHRHHRQQPGVGLDERRVDSEESSFDQGSHEWVLLLVPTRRSDRRANAPPSVHQRFGAGAQEDGSDSCTGCDSGRCTSPRRSAAAAARLRTRRVTTRHIAPSDLGCRAATPRALRRHCRQVAHHRRDVRGRGGQVRRRPRSHGRDDVDERAVRQLTRGPTSHDRPRTGAEGRCDSRVVRVR